MEQIAVSFTNQGQPATGLTPTVTIWRKDGKQIVENDACKEIAGGWYVYNFRQYNNDNVYLYLFDGGNTLSDYDRYKYGGNELDAYTNKYSWGRTAAPYFTTLNKRFDSVDKAFTKQEKNKYKDTEVQKKLTEISGMLKARGGYDVFTALDGMAKTLEDIKKSIVDTSSASDGNNSNNFSSIGSKLDMMADYIVDMRETVDSELTNLDENVAQRISESNDMLTGSFNDGMANKVNIDQLLQQVERLEEKLNEVVDSVVSKRLSDELVDKYNVNVSRKPRMSDEEAYNLLMGEQQHMQPMESGMEAMGGMQPMEGMEQPEPTSGMQGRPNLNGIL